MDLIKSNFIFEEGAKIQFLVVKKFFIENNICNVNLIQLLKQSFGPSVRRSKNRKFILNLIELNSQSEEWDSDDSDFEEQNER